MSKIRGTLLVLFFLAAFQSFSQPLDEIIKIDTTNEILKVIYKKTDNSTYYYKKIAVFANDTSQIAIEKTFTKNGQNGIYKIYYPSGRLKVFTVYANDNINGEFTYYDPNGIILIKGIYKNGVKHKYWAYKSLKIYGRYKKGKKNGKWYQVDSNNKKKKSYYKKGKLVKGEGFGNEQVLPANAIDTTIKDSETFVAIVKYKEAVSKEYQQAVSFLTKNVVFRKAFKAHISRGNLKIIRELKPYFKKERFHFLLSPAVVNLDISKFMSDSEQGKITVASIDSVLKGNSENLKLVFKGEGEVGRNDDLYDYSTDTYSPITVYFSEITHQLLRIDVVNYKEFSEDTFSFGMYQTIPVSQKFQVLLYFDKEGVLKGAEYEKP